jgi:hypothetical protein
MMVLHLPPLRHRDGFLEAVFQQAAEAQKKPPAIDRRKLPPPGRRLAGDYGRGGNCSSGRHRRSSSASGMWAASSLSTNSSSPSSPSRPMIGQFVSEGALWLADLYGVEVRRVGGHEHQLRSPGLDEIPYPLGPVRPEVVHHHNLPLGKRRGQEVLYVGLEGFRVRGSLDAHRLSHPRKAHRGDKRQVLAPVLGHSAVSPLSPGSPRA